MADLSDVEHEELEELRPHERQDERRGHAGSDDPGQVRDGEAAEAALEACKEPIHRLLALTRSAPLRHCAAERAPQLFGDPHWTHVVNVARSAGVAGPVPMVLSG